MERVHGSFRDLELSRTRKVPSGWPSNIFCKSKAKKRRRERAMGKLIRSKRVRGKHSKTIIGLLSRSYKSTQHTHPSTLNSSPSPPLVLLLSLSLQFSLSLTLSLTLSRLLSLSLSPYIGLLAAGGAHIKSRILRHHNAIRAHWRNFMRTLLVLLMLLRLQLGGHFLS